MSATEEDWSSASSGSWIHKHIKYVPSNSHTQSCLHKPYKTHFFTLVIVRTYYLVSEGRNKRQSVTFLKNQETLSRPITTRVFVPCTVFHDELFMCENLCV